MTTLLVLVAGIVVGAAVYMATSGHVLFLPILLVLPPLLIGARRRT